MKRISRVDLLVQTARRYIGDAFILNAPNILECTQNDVRYCVVLEE